MTEQIQIETLLKLADLSFQEYSRINSYTWNLNYGLWSALAIISGFAIKEGDKFQVRLRKVWRVVSVVAVWLTMGFIFCFYFISIRSTYLGMDVEHQRVRVCINKVTEIISLDTTQIIEPKPLFFKKMDIKECPNFKVIQSNATQLFLTFILLVFTGCVLTRRQLSLNPPRKIIPDASLYNLKP